VARGARPVHDRRVLEPNDEALRERLVCERALAHLVSAELAPDTCSLPGRAAGLLHLLRREREGREAVDEAARGRPRRLAERLEPETLAGLEPPLVHHLALVWEALARAHADRADARWPSERRATALAARALAAWAHLAAEARYLEELARRVAGQALPDGGAERLAREAGALAVERVTEAALAGARERKASARAYLGALRESASIARVAGLDRDASARLAAELERARASVVDEALAPLAASLAEAKAQGDEVRRGPALLGEVAKAWTFCHEDVAVERFAVEQLAPVAWVAYKDPGWNSLRALFVPLEGLLESFARRFEGPRAEWSTTELAYAAPCAQTLVFRSELAEGDRRFVLVERALAICPGHRNARIVLAGLLLELAVTGLSQRGWLLEAHELELSRARIARAEELWPTHSQLEHARGRLRELEARVRWRAP
jgi:hypothetical protein